VESTHNLILVQFPPQERHNASLLKLADRVEALVRAGTLHSRLDALVALLAWLRNKDNKIPELSQEGATDAWASAEWRRERVWLSILAASPELRDRHNAAIAAILEETDGVSLFAQAGLPTDRGLIPEMFERLFLALLPAPREENDLAKLFLRMFPTNREVGLG
jgi:site-specific recombinase